MNHAFILAGIFVAIAVVSFVAGVYYSKSVIAKETAAKAVVADAKKVL